MDIDLKKGFELHNATITSGRIRARAGLFSHRVPTVGTTYVGGFSIESPSTTEKWHYLFERSTTTGATTLRVSTEDMEDMYTYQLGVLTANPSFTYALNLNQIIINSPAMSAPLYGVIGGGLTTAIKEESDFEGTTAIDIPSGICCSFGDRVAIGDKNTVYFSDPDISPRSFVGENTWSVSGQILDMFQGIDGALYAFTTGNVHVLSADALGKGQEVEGFATVIPGINVSRERNAAVSNGKIMVLQQDMLNTLGGAGQHLATYEGRRRFTPNVEVDDLRTSCRIFAVSDGFMVSYTDKGIMMHIDVKNDFKSFVWTQSLADMNLVGVLTGRDGEDLFVMSDRVCEMVGNKDFNNTSVQVFAAGRVEVSPEKAGVMRGATISSDSAKQPVMLMAGGQAITSATAVRPGDILLDGSSVWSATRKFVGRTLRSTLLRVSLRTSDMNIEVGCTGANRVLGNLSIDIRGQAPGRRDKMR